MRYKGPPADGLPDRPGILRPSLREAKRRSNLGVALAPWIDSLRSK